MQGFTLFSFVIFKSNQKKIISKKQFNLVVFLKIVTTWFQVVTFYSFLIKEIKTLNYLKYFLNKLSIF